MLPAGPYRTLKTIEGEAFPYYIIPFDNDGQCEGPQTREHLIGAAGGYTDIFLFSHGWNNDWTTATNRYESFIRGFQDIRKQYDVAMPPGYKPLLVGIFWPSQALTWFNSETGPDFAATDPSAQDEAQGTFTDTLRDIASTLPAQERPRFYELAQAQTLDKNEAQEFAAMLAKQTGADEEEVRKGPPNALDLLAAATALETPEPDYNAIGAVGVTGGQPAAAFDFGDVLSKLDPRNIIKPFTVWTMKDRAGRVGAQGVSPLLRALLEKSDTRVHLLGHSFGCKVVMTATACLPENFDKKVESALLLQPAVSQYAFCAKVPQRNVPGGYVKNLKRIRRPIVATFSANDSALTKMFHLAVRRSDDLGELQYAAGGTPSIYGALGGFGPQDSNETIENIRDPRDAYNLSGTGRIIGINGTRTISAHGDISNPSTWWLAFQLATANLRHP